MYKLGLPRLPMPKGPQIPRGIGQLNPGQFNPFMPRPFEGGMQGPGKGYAHQPGMPMFPGFNGGQLHPPMMPGMQQPVMPMHPPMPFEGGMQPGIKPDDIRRGQPGIGMNPFAPLMNFGRQVQRY